MKLRKILPLIFFSIYLISFSSATGFNAYTDIIGDSIITSYTEYVNMGENSINVSLGVILHTYNVSSYENVSIILSPINQMKNIDNRDIGIIKIRYCNGDIDENEYSIKLIRCNGLEVNISNITRFIQYNTSNKFGNYSYNKYIYSFNIKQFKSNSNYAFLIEYEIKNSIQMTNDFYYFVEADSIPMSANKAFILPKGVSPEKWPEGGTPILLSNGQWIIFANSVASGKWYILSYSKEAFHKTFKGYIISIFLSAVIGFIFGLFDKKRITKFLKNKIKEIFI